MKSLVVFYSWTGNTEAVAEELGSVLQGKVVRLEETKERKPGFGFAMAAMYAIFGAKSKLKPLSLPSGEFDTIFVGTPIWASASTPAVNTFLSRFDFKGKKVYLFFTLADDKPPVKAITSMTRRIERKGGRVLGNFTIQTKFNGELPTEKLPAAEVKARVAKWISTIK